ncbi:ATP-binding protein [Thermococcus argininiproducens]|uniref:ATP-binding protein n=1 Tax=Thermococcus argininiproducens TaxID=2866384 RepID=A0A9E7SD40_9EURY|nr:ATP-binding protein [Thermococcus argininiproducens]USH00431.1 ATP-binding protein [Thermococcus argininiproducens]
MRFIDRDTEMRILEEAKKRSKKKLYTLVVYGLRRVGKTRLLLEFLREKDLYFFVNRGKTSESLLREYEEILKKRGAITKYEHISSWDEFFEVLFERFEGVVVFDEFQDFQRVEPSVFSTLQKLIDLHESRKNLMLVFTGSTIGMIEKIFRDSKEPLYGRIKRELHLKELGIKASYKLSRELEIEEIDDFMKLYAVFGGLPKYYVAIEDEGLEGKSAEEIIKNLFFSPSAPLEEEVPRILSLEFGRRSGVYYDILEAVANGATSLSKIAGYMNREETSLTRQIKELVDYFKLLSYDKAILGKERVIYIRHPLLNFWFRFVHPRLSEYEAMREELGKEVISMLSDFTGKRFDFICRELLWILNGKGELPFKFTEIGRHWGYYRENEQRKVYEIDIVALSRDRKRALFGECKWRNKPVNGEKVLEDLKRKVELSNWKGESYYLLIARKVKNAPENLIVLDERKILQILGT